jgi:outer membrane scaffolding protein for murein synthesis (MipA/OmpV family)
MTLRLCYVKKAIHYLMLLLAALYSVSSAAQETRWEMGVGVVAIDLPLYPGSSQDASYILPFPYLRLESKYLNIDQGIESKLFKSSKVRFSLSGGLGVPVNSADSTAREGMPDLDLVLQVGPSLDVIFDQRSSGAREFRLELPLRLAVATDFSSTRNTGWLFEPRLVYESKRKHKSGWAYEYTAGLRFATDKYHGYYYNVDPQFETLARPQYSASGGYSGLFTDLIASWRRNNLIYFAWVRYQYLGGAQYEDSPLFADNNYVFVGIGLNWIFAESL